MRTKGLLAVCLFGWMGCIQIPWGYPNQLQVQVDVAPVEGQGTLLEINRFMAPAVTIHDWPKKLLGESIAVGDAVQVRGASKRRAAPTLVASIVASPSAIFSMKFFPHTEL